MDIVYLLKDKYNGEELRYSLRSLENIPHDKVFFVGGCPEWAKNIIHIPTEQTGTKYKNTTNNLITACNDPRVSSNLILMNDDFFILDHITEKELNLCMGPIKEVLNKLLEKNKLFTPYMVGMRETEELLKSLGKEEPLSYELHIPMVINKDNFLKMFDIEGVKEVHNLHKRSLYGNLYLTESKRCEDVKVTDKFNKKLYKKFLSCSDDGFFYIKDFLLSIFPNKSKYEV